MKKTALVTGGSGGIGSEICRALAEDGWQVAVCYKNGRAAAEALVSITLRQTAEYTIVRSRMQAGRENG